MSHALHISDEAYDTLTAVARERGQTPEAFIEAWAAEQAQALAEADRDPHTDPRYETFEAFFRGLGMAEEEIQRAKQVAETEDADL